MGKHSEGVSATRMELLLTKRRRLLAEKGHKLLTEKRDTLISHFFSTIDERTMAKTKVARKLEDAYSALLEAEQVMGRDNVYIYALSIEPQERVKIRHESVMGIKIPKIDVLDNNKSIKYPFLGTSAHLDKAMKKFDEAFVEIMKLAEIEHTIRTLAREIEKVKRRVNALEHIIIPAMLKAEKYIEFRLEEAEREDFFRRKRIKQLMAKRESTG